MAISLNSLRRTGAPKPPILGAYGVGGIGKTSLAADAPSPVFLFFEDGAGMLEVDSFGVLKSYGQAMEAIAALDSDAHDFKTVAVDTLDWLEPLIWEQTCLDNGWKDIEQPGYGKGYAAADALWREFLSGLAYLRDERGMTVILLAHAEIKRFESPETEAYDRYAPKLKKGAAAIVQEYVDGLFFVNYRVSTVKDEAGPKKKITRGVGGGDRLLYTEERPAFLAKNRWAMPPSLPLDWGAVASQIPFFNQQTPANAAASE